MIWAAMLNVGLGKISASFEFSAKENWQSLTAEIHILPISVFYVPIRFQSIRNFSFSLVRKFHSEPSTIFDTPVVHNLSRTLCQWFYFVVAEIPANSADSLWKHYCNVDTLFRVRHNYLLRCCGCHNVVILLKSPVKILVQDWTK